MNDTTPPFPYDELPNSGDDKTQDNNIPVARDMDIPPATSLFEYGETSAPPPTPLEVDNTYGYEFDPLAYDPMITPQPTGEIPPYPLEKKQEMIQASGLNAWIEKLNSAQRQAVESIEGPVLIVAGAGTGKTRVLTTRLSKIVVEKHASPGQILCVTFTNKAAAEMKKRVNDASSPISASGIWLGTFHGICARILRYDGNDIDVKSDFVIIDTDDQVRLLKQIMEDMGFDVQDKVWSPRAVLAHIQRWKDKSWSPERVPEDERCKVLNGRGVDVYTEYQKRLLILNACDFGDLLLHCLTLFTKFPKIGQKYQRMFKYIMVDEYQDTNVAQYLWLRYLAMGHKNICCVGDDDQSIYGWRGAESGIMLRFEKEFDNTTVVRLEENYRSTSQILQSANMLIANNQGRMGKNLFTNSDDGENLKLYGYWNDEEEARGVADSVENYQRRGFLLSNMAILVRTGSQTRAFEERFMHLNIPCKVIGGHRFYEREEARDALAYLRLINQPHDSLAFERVINKPARKIGATTIQLLHGLSRKFDISLWQASRMALDEQQLKSAAHKALAKAISLFEHWRSVYQSTRPELPDFLDRVLDESGYMDMWQHSKKLEAQGKIENLREMINHVSEFETLEQYLEHVSLVMETEQNAGEDSVSIMTLHGAKGLEFDVVYLPGWDEGLFPSSRSMDENGIAGLEEERRLAYVGITRAKKIACISTVANRRMFIKDSSGKSTMRYVDSLPSRFVYELPEQYVDDMTDAGLYAGSGGGRAEDRSTMYTRGSDHAQNGYENSNSRHNENRRSFGGGYDGLKRNPNPLSGGRSSEFFAGCRIHHKKFGDGTVSIVDGEHLTIDFDYAGRKKVVASFVEKKD